MNFAGIDLAWSERKPTGLAVLDDAGRLIHLSIAQTDQDVIDALSTQAGPDCLIAVDAPLIVKNATGSRPAETALNQDFARFDAGVSPSNTSKPAFASTPRGARLASLLGLDLNPRSGRPRRAIEVAPQAATIALFRLGRTLKYSQKPGRDLDTLRGELLILVGLLEGLATAEPTLRLIAKKSPWPALVKAAETASRKSELRVVQSQVDAVLCAYLARFAGRRPDRTTTYGDLETGYFVTPTLPAGHTPARRTGETATETAIEVMAPDPATAAVRQYAEEYDTVAEAGRRFLALVTAILDEAGINYLSVTGRTKSVASFAAKAARQVDGKPQYADPLRDITDQIGVRVITYVLSDVAVVADLMADQMIVKVDRDMGQVTASQGRFGYASRHLLIGLDAVRSAQPAYQQLRDRVASVQIRTVLQHAWAEFEHDIRYKGAVPDEHASEFDRRFTLAAGLLELADREFSTIRDRLRVDPAERSSAPDDDPRIDPRELAAFLAGQYADAGWSRTDHYAWISGLLLELAITSLDELSDVLRPVNELDLNARMAYRYPPGAVRRLDDALLAAFGERYLHLHGNAHRVPSLQARRTRLLAEPPPAD